MDYKKMMGYGNKKKVDKKVSKPKKTVLDEVKKELNEWSHQPPTAKRWSKDFNGDDGLTEFEQQGGKDNVNEGPAADYAPYLHAIKQNYDKYWDSVKEFQKVLDKKGLKGASKGIGNAYKNLVLKFHKLLDKMVRKLL